MTTPTDRIVTTPDGQHPNAGKTNLCARCGGDPTFAKGAKAIGTRGCICGVVRAFGGPPDVDDGFISIEMPDAIRAHATLDSTRFVFERSEGPARLRSDAFGGRVFHTSGTWVVVEPASGAATLDAKFATGVTQALSAAAKPLGTITRAQVEDARRRNESFRLAPAELDGALFDAHLALDLFDVVGWTGDVTVAAFAGHATPAKQAGVRVETMGVFRFERDGVTVVLAGMQYATPVTIEASP